MQNQKESNGKSNPDKLFDMVLSKHALFAKALFERPESFSKFLPYEEYLSEFELFRQKDHSLGVVYEVTLCEHEVKTSREIIALLESLKQWFCLSEELTLSLLFDQSPISSHDPIWDELAGSKTDEETDFPQKIYLNKLKVFQGLTTEPKVIPKPLRRKLYLSIRNFWNPNSYRHKLGGIHQIFGNPNETLLGEVEKNLRLFREFNHSLSQFEMTSPLPLRRLCAAEFATLLRRTFNPVTYFKRPFAAINPKLSLSEQLIYCSTELDYPGIMRERLKTRTITLKNAPHFAYPGSMAYFLSLDFPFRMGINISFPSSTKIKRHFGLKDFFLQNTPSARTRRQKAEIDLLQEKLLRDDRVLNMTFCVFLEGDDNEGLDLKTKECLARFQQKLECEAIVEKEIGLGLWFNSLPLCYHPSADFTSRRAIRILKSDLVHFLPVFDSFRGSQKAQSLFLSRERGLVPFDIKSVGNSHMMAVLGDIGSGKSAQVIQLLLGELRRNPKPVIFVLDHKTSYGMVSKYLKSEITTFEAGKPMPFSPFRGALDEDKLRFLVHLLTSAIQMTSTNFVLESEHRTCLTESLRNAYFTKAQTAGVRYQNGFLVEGSQDETHLELNVTLDDVISAMGALTGQTEFEKYGQFVDEITKKLRPF